jgi:hypothetical protein
LLGYLAARKLLDQVLAIDGEPADIARLASHTVRP